MGREKERGREGERLGEGEKAKKSQREWNGESERGTGRVREEQGE